jgi:acetyltransferase-like isoleucine patch superfamily enzyme
MTLPQAIPGDWYDGIVPPNVVIGEGVHIETSFSFHRFASRLGNALRLGRGVSVYGQSVFDFGPEARAEVGNFTLLNSVWITCDQQVSIGSHCLLSWNVMIMDSRRVPFEPSGRAQLLQQAIAAGFQWPTCPVRAERVTIGNNVWIGFDSVVLPGVAIGDGSVIGARSVVFEDVPAYCVAVGNPAHVIRQLERPKEACLEKR